MNHRILRFLPLTTLALVWVVSLGGCPLIPTLKDRIVELAVGGTTSADFSAEGLINTYAESHTVDVHDSLDVSALLDDAGIDASDVDSIAVSGVTLQVTQPDPEPTRTITGTVTVARGAGSALPFVTDAELVNADTSPITAPLDPAGVALINGLLQDLLSEVKTGVPATNTSITYAVDGASTPSDVSTDFKWRLTLHVNIKGKVKIKTLE